MSKGNPRFPYHVIPLTDDEGVVTKIVRHPFETEQNSYRLLPELKERCRDLLGRYGKELQPEEASEPAEESRMKMSVILTLQTEEGKEESFIFRAQAGGMQAEAAEEFRKLFYDLTRDDNKISSESLYPKLKECREIREVHGPVCGAEYSYYSGGMMYGSNQTIKKIVEKLDTGRVRVTVRKQAGDQPEVSESRELDSDILEKIQEISERENLATWEYACIDPSIPVDRFNMPTDLSRSDSIAVIYDDSTITGAPAVKRSIGEAACRMGGKEVFDRICQLIGEAEEAGGIQVAMPLYKLNQYPGFQPPTAQTGTAQAGTAQAGTAKTVSPGQWLCSCGEANEGKFCSNCGMKKPLV